MSRTLRPLSRLCRDHWTSWSISMSMSISMSIPLCSDRWPHAVSAVTLGPAAARGAGSAFVGGINGLHAWKQAARSSHPGSEGLDPGGSGAHVAAPGPFMWRRRHVEPLISPTFITSCVGQQSHWLRAALLLHWNVGAGLCTCALRGWL